MKPTDFNEARKEGRIMSVYRTCYVGTDENVQFALLRNLSEGGAQVEADISAPVGATVFYALDEGARIEAEIRWKKDGRIGLANLAKQELQNESFPRRAIRLPLRYSGDAWVDGQHYNVRIVNVSQQGARLIGLPRVPVGKPIFLKIGSLEIHSVTARWVGDVATGVKFPTPLPIAQLNDILSAESGRVADPSAAPQHDFEVSDPAAPPHTSQYYKGKAA